MKQTTGRIVTMTVDFYRIVSAAGDDEDYLTAREAIKAAQLLADETGSPVDVYEHSGNESVSILMTVRPSPLS